MSKGPKGRGEDGEFNLEDFVTDEITGINTLTYADRVKDRLRETGIGDYATRPLVPEELRGVFLGLKPGDYFNGKLPTVVRKLSLDQLSALYSLFTSWYAYLTYQTNLVAVERSEAKKQMDFIWSHVRKQMKLNRDGSKNSDQVATDNARCDFRYLKALARYEENNVFYNCMLSTLEVTEQDMKMISREVTINQAKMEKDAIGAGFSRRFNRPWSKEDTGEDDDEDSSPRKEKTRRVRIDR
jgi:hypothetical protein